MRKLDAGYNLVGSVTEVAKLAMNGALRELILEGNPIANKR